MENIPKELSEILELLKKRFQEVCGAKLLLDNGDFGKTFMSLKKPKENLIHSMDECHVAQFKSSGRHRSKIPHTVASLYSSEAFAFNILGNKNITVKENSFLNSGKYEIKYNYALMNLRASTHHKPMQIGARLLSEKKHLKIAICSQVCLFRKE